MGMESMYIPLVMGGLGAMQGGLGGGGDQEPFMLEPYGGYPGAFLDPRRMLTQNVRDVAHLGAIMGERAAAPVALPGTFMQPSQWYSGGGLPFPMGRTAMDPSLFAPDVHQARPGAKFAEPEYVTGTADGQEFTSMHRPERWLFGADQPVPRDENNKLVPQLEGGYAPRETGGHFDLGTTPFAGGEAKHKIESMRPQGPERWAALDQGPTSPAPVVGGGVPRLMANLQLMGVTADPNTGGLVNQGPEEIGNLALFTGSGNVKRRYPGGPAPGTIQTPTWAPEGGDLGAPLTVPQGTPRPNPGTFGWSPTATIPGRFYDGTDPKGTKRQT